MKPFYPLQAPPRVRSDKWHNVVAIILKLGHLIWLPRC